MGWRTRLRENYDESFEQFAAYDEMYGISSRLGYDDPQAAWDENPVIEGGVLPKDFRKVRN
jgi:hypothetical protein